MRSPPPPPPPPPKPLHNAILGTEESSHCGEVAINNFLGGVQHAYCAKFMLTVPHNGNPIINNI